VKYDHKLKPLSFERRGYELWVEVEVLNGPYQGQVGYVAFENKWFNPKHFPDLDEEFVASIKNQPQDYGPVMQDYLQYLSITDSEKDFKKAKKLMLKSRATTYEVHSDVMRKEVIALAQDYRLTGDHMAIVLKKDRGKLQGQHMYVIDGDRIIAIAISSAESLPAGTFKNTGSTDFSTLKSFGVKLDSRSGKRARNLWKGGKNMVTGRIGFEMIEPRNEAMKEGYEEKFYEGLFIYATDREKWLGDTDVKVSKTGIRLSGLDQIYLTSILDGAPLEFAVVGPQEQLT